MSRSEITTAIDKIKWWLTGISRMGGPAPFDNEVHQALGTVVQAALKIDEINLNPNKDKQDVRVVVHLKLSDDTLSKVVDINYTNLLDLQELMTVDTVKYVTIGNMIVNKDNILVLEFSKKETSNESTN